jgi:hypothetical protein
MNDILMYISLGIKIVILIILIAILLKINLMSPVKKIEKFTTKGSTTPPDTIYCTSTVKDKSNPTCSLTKSERKKLNNVSRDAFETNKNDKLKIITYDEIVIIKDDFEKLAARANNLTIDTEQLARPFEKVNSYSYMNGKEIDNSRIIEFIKIIGDKMDIIKKNMDDVINIANKARYINYYYYTDYWHSFNFSDNRIKSRLFTPLNSALKSIIIDIEPNIIDYYLFAKAFIELKEGTNIYNIYTNAVAKKTLFYRFKNKITQGRYQIDIHKIYYDDVKRRIWNKDKGRWQVVNDLKDKYDTGAPTYYANYFYIWKLYDSTVRKYIAEGSKPEVKLTGGGIYQFDGAIY